MKLSKTQLHKRGKLGVPSGRFLGPLLKTGLPFLGNAVKPLAKSVLVPFGLTAPAPATDAAVHKKMFGSGTHSLDSANQTTSIISNEKMNDNMKITRYLEGYGLLIKGLKKHLKMNQKNKNKDFSVCY